MKNPLLTLALLLAGSLTLFSQSISKPYVETVDDRACYIEKIETRGKYTVVSFEHKNNGSWIQLSDKIYILGPDSTRYRYLKSENISMAPTKYYFREDEPVHPFKVYFEAVPASVKKIDIIEEDGQVYAFNFYGVSLERSRTSDTQMPHSLPDIAADTTASASPFPGSFLNALTPLYGSMMKSILDSSLEFYKQPGKLTELAKLQRDYYDALMKQGFSSQQALQILISNPLVGKGSLGGLGGQ